MANEYEVSSKSKGLSFINWEELNEEEFHKLKKILNAPMCTGVQFPFSFNGDKTADKFQHGPVFQPAVPPPPILGYPIPVHHWTPGDPSVIHPSGPPYSIALQGTYMFSNSTLAATGDGSMAFVPALNTGQPMYTLPAPHLLPTHYTTAPQSEPVDLTVPVTCPVGDIVLQQQGHSSAGVMSEPCAHQVMLAHMSLAGNNSNFMPSLGLSHAGIRHHLEGSTQVVYIAQQNVAPTVSPDEQANSQTFSDCRSNAGHQTVQRTPSIEFGGPVVFSSYLPDAYHPEPNNNKTLANHDIVHDEVVIDMEGLHLSKRSSQGEILDNQGALTQHSLQSAVPVTDIPSHLESLDFKKPSLHTDESCESQSPTNTPEIQDSADTNRLLESEPKQAPVPPPKMWSSLFGKNKANGTSQSADMSLSSVAAVPNAFLKEEVKSVRYWQEKEKAEAKQSLVPTEKVITVGPQNDPFAVKILEQLLTLQIVHSPIVIQPRGLVNGSNICFMNATLQVLMGCPPFIHLFRAFKDLPPRPGSYSSTPIFDSLVQFVNSFQNGQRIRTPGSRNKKGTLGDINLGQPFTPTPLLNVAQNILGLHIGVQHDAEEFLSQILMICHEELENIMKLNTSNGFINNDKPKMKNGSVANDASVTDDEQQDDCESWQKVGPKNHHVETNINDCGETPLSNIFAGLSRSCLTRESGKTSDTLDSFFTLKLDIQAENVHSVYDALLRLNSSEAVLDAEGGKVQGQRRMFFDILPPVLIMHLKLFQYSNGNGQKIQKKIDFDVDLTIPKETLSRVAKTKFLSQKSRTYKLFGVVNHHGIKMNDGHYTSDVYLPAVSGWLRFDDSEVITINELQVLQYSERRMPYLLFYRRMDLTN